MYDQREHTPRELEGCPIPWPYITLLVSMPATFTPVALAFFPLYYN
jgi:hypothetical protein